MERDILMPALTKAELLKIFPAASKSKLDVDKLVSALNETFFHQLTDEVNFSTLNRRAAFLAQCGHESAGFSRVTENLNYSAEGLNKVFRKYFPTVESAKLYARQPQKIANRVYANRMGNGNESSGDGWKYRGRGFIQLTGKFNYHNCGIDIGVDLVNKPEYLETMEGALKSAMWYWNKRKINVFADKNDIVGMTKAINGGTIGLEDRRHHYEIAKKLLAD